jgi:hypothetical protein
MLSNEAFILTKRKRIFADFVFQDLFKKTFQDLEK